MGGRTWPRSCPGSTPRSPRRWWWCSSRPSTPGPAGPGWSGGPRWPGRWPRGVCSAGPVRWPPAPRIAARCGHRGPAPVHAGAVRRPGCGEAGRACGQQPGRPVGRDGAPAGGGEGTRSRWRCTGRSCPRTRRAGCRSCRRTCRASMTRCWPTSLVTTAMRTGLGADVAAERKSRWLRNATKKRHGFIRAIGGQRTVSRSPPSAPRGRIGPPRRLPAGPSNRPQRLVERVGRRAPRPRTAGRQPADW